MKRIDIMPSIMRMMNIISRCEGLYRTDKLKGTDLNAVHHSYIFAICKHPGISQDELARHICINKSNVTRNLAYLEQKGYVERRQSESDKRVTLVYPTDKMLAVLPSVRKTVREWNEYISENISEEELSAFKAVLERITERARDYADTREEVK